MGGAKKAGGGTPDTMTKATSSKRASKRAPTQKPAGKVKGRPVKSKKPAAESTNPKKENTSKKPLKRAAPSSLQTGGSNKRIRPSTPKDGGSDGVVPLSSWKTPSAKSVRYFEQLLVECGQVTLSKVSSSKRPDAVRFLDGVYRRANAAMSHDQFRVPSSTRTRRIDYEKVESENKLLSDVILSNEMRRTRLESTLEEEERCLLEEKTHLEEFERAKEKAFKHQEKLHKLKLHPLLKLQHSAYVPTSDPAVIPSENDRAEADSPLESARSSLTRALLKLDRNGSALWRLFEKLEGCREMCEDLADSLAMDQR